jgi:hypothetical protein
MVWNTDIDIQTLKDAVQWRPYLKPYINNIPNIENKIYNDYNIYLETHHIDNHPENELSGNILRVTIEQHASIHLWMWDQYKLDGNLLKNNNYSDNEFDIKKHYVILSSEGDYNKEINLVSWYNDSPKIEIRSWPKDHRYGGYGIRFTRDEAETVWIWLKNILHIIEENNIYLNHCLSLLEKKDNMLERYKDERYEINLYRLKERKEILSTEANLEKTIGFVYWDSGIPWISEKYLKGLKIDIRHWPLSLDEKHRGHTLDDNIEIKKTIEAFDSYINDTTWDCA